MTRILPVVFDDVAPVVPVRHLDATERDTDDLVSMSAPTGRGTGHRFVDRGGVAAVGDQTVQWPPGTDRIQSVYDATRV